MSGCRTSRVVLGLSAVLALLVLAPGLDVGLLYLAPAFLLALPLLCRRYVGEERIARLVARRAVPALRRVAGRARPAVRAPRALVPRSGRLIACSLASRPPPRALLSA